MIQKSKKRKSDNERVLSGEITLFLALIFILMISFTAALMESASIQASKSYRRADMGRAIESCFAEYQKDLLKEYDIFSLEGTYETGNYSEDNLLNRIAYYGGANIDQDITKIQMLTDQSGKAFQDQVARYGEGKYLAKLPVLFDAGSLAKQEKDFQDSQKQSETWKSQVDSMLAQGEGELPAEGNPVADLNRLQTMPLVSLVMPKEKSVSSKGIPLEGTVSHRTLVKGRGDFSDRVEDEALSAPYLVEYVLTHFQTATDDVKKDSKEALEYQAEYILVGKSTDKENLEGVLRRLLGIRFVPNYAYIRTDSEMRAEAEAIAIPICTLAMAPEAINLMTEALLVSWAIGESIMDLRVLMKGDAVPLMKSKETWQLSLSALMKLGTSEDAGGGKNKPGGVKYDYYLASLLALEGKNKASMRCLDMIELHMQQANGYSWFKADQCINKVEIDSIARLRRGIHYQFVTYYGYR